MILKFMSGHKSLDIMCGGLKRLLVEILMQERDILIIHCLNSTEGKI